MKFIIIIPAHNEAHTILKCLESLASQTYQNFDCIVVNDGSSDHTPQLVTTFIKDHPNFKVINLESSKHQPGAKVVRTFYAGLNTVMLSEYDIICKFDADIIFPNHYLERLNDIYSTHPKVGMASGLVYVKKGNQWQFENLSSKHHVRGPIKSYRISCFKAMNGLRETLGWDNIDVMLAQMYGYEIYTDKQLWVKHLRPTAEKYKSEKAKKLGAYFYNLGLNLPLAMVSSLKSSYKNRSAKEFFITMKSFIHQKHPRLLSKEEIKYIRHHRNPLKNLFKSSTKNRKIHNAYGIKL